MVFCLRGRKWEWEIFGVFVKEWYCEWDWNRVFVRGWILEWVCDVVGLRVCNWECEWDGVLRGFETEKQNGVVFVWEVETENEKGILII